jgi:hypothetical protein
MPRLGVGLSASEGGRGQHGGDSGSQPETKGTKGEMTRQEQLDAFVADKLERLVDDVNDTDQLQPKNCVDFLWWEIRESVVLALFALDHEQTFSEIHAKWVKENCT